MSGTTKHFIVQSLAKCSIPGDLDCTVAFTNDSDFSPVLGLLSGQMLGPGSPFNDSCLCQIKFQEQGKILSLGDADGVIEVKRTQGSGIPPAPAAESVKFSFSAADLYADPCNETDPYNCAFSDLRVDATVYFIPPRSRGVLASRSLASPPPLLRALSITLHPRTVTCRVGINNSVPEGVVAIPKWMWPNLCPLTAAEAAGSAAAAVPPSPSTSAAAAGEGGAAPDSLVSDGLRGRKVSVSLLFSSQLPVATGAVFTCTKKSSIDPAVPAPNFTELSQWNATLRQQLESVNKDLHGFFSLHAGAHFTFKYCGWLCVHPSISTVTRASFSVQVRFQRARAARGSAWRRRGVITRAAHRLHSVDVGHIH